LNELSITLLYTKCNDDMTKREVVKMVLNGKKPPYVPWSFKYTQEPKETLVKHFKTEDLDTALDNHILNLGADIGFFKPIGNNLYEDVFGTVWDRSVDKDIGILVNNKLPKPSLQGYKFPNPQDPRYFEDIHREIEKHGDMFRVYQIGFSLHERAWTLRGFENLLMDFYENPSFVHELYGAIVDYNIEQMKKAMEYDIDAIYFGDDWGKQDSLIMGAETWREFIKPHLKKMYGFVKQSGKYLMIHSCGKVDELFDDLVGIGLNCFNPFQPEVMDVHSLVKKYRGKLAFHGGLSTQQTLPYGTPEDVKKATQKLIDTGKDGGLIISPAHSMESDVSLENMLAMIDTCRKQIK
jgi:uroporphyrinogen decarboxylase